MQYEMLDVFAIHGENQGDKKLRSWPRIGVAFINKDKSINVLLDAIPVTGKIHIRKRKEKSTANRDEEK